MFSSRRIRERTVEEYLTHRVEKAGGWAVKVKGVAQNGWPDRQVFWPHIPPQLVETKAKNGVLSGPQQTVHERLLEEFNTKVFVIYNRWQVDEYIAKYAPTLEWRELYAQLRAPSLSD